MKFRGPKALNDNLSVNRLERLPTTGSNCRIPHRQYSFFAIRLGLRTHLAAMVKELKKVKVRVFDAQAFLDSAGVARKVKDLRRRGSSTLKVIPLTA